MERWRIRIACLTLSVGSIGCKRNARSNGRRMKVTGVMVGGRTGRVRRKLIDRSFGYGRLFNGSCGFANGGRVVDVLGVRVWSCCDVVYGSGLLRGVVE